ncbi:AAA family ATPase [Mesobacillus jeotgali]|uniref:AAA family ATPase n=1 Tax=Mesobacillus jeotgali TaxID=129985 RepID=UPI001CFF51F9|nr:AAA family ATPase [Mesobacillus jeotgali]
MLVRFNTLTLQNYKCHRELEVKFGDLTKITADNAKGKSSIPESVSWLFYGTDALGGKTDPTPITYGADETLVQLLLSVDEKQLLLGRGLKKGKTQYYINEVPSKAGDFNEVVEQMFDKDLFLSLFNPSYFFTLHWEKQRGMLLQYVSAPARKEVLKHLPETLSTTLEKYLKKHSLDDLEKIHKDNKNRKDKAYIAAQSKTKTLQEQLGMIKKPEMDIDSLRAESDELTKQIQEADELPAKAWENNKKINSLQNEIQFLAEQRDHMKAQFPALKNEQINDSCRTCGQSLDEESRSKAEEDKSKRIAEFKKKYDGIVLKRKELEEELSKLEYIDATEQQQKVRELEATRDKLMDQIRIYDRYSSLHTQVKNAEADEAATLQDLNASIFILDSIKQFKAKEAELQGEKVQVLFTSLSIKLFEELKNGDFKPSFEIEMDGKGYRKLSLSEGIRAGLELRDVLSKQSELITPCFVDNAESITSFKQPNGQLIISRVVAGQDLKVEVE